MPLLHDKLRPWGVTLAGRESRGAAEAEARRLSLAHARLLAGERIDYVQARYPGMTQARHFAQVGRDTRAQADLLCGRLQAAGAGCIVRRN